MRPINDKAYSIVETANVNKMARENPKQLVENSEEYYNTQVMSAAITIKEQMPRYKFVLLCGPSASGKTTTAHKLKHRLIAQGVGARVVSMDDFFIGLEAYGKLPNGKPDMESVDAVDMQLLNHCFDELLNDGTSMFPRFDFNEQQRVLACHKVELGKNDVLIMEGIHAFNPMTLRQIPKEAIFRLYVSVRTKFVNDEQTILLPREIRLIRRMVRDKKFRNYTPLDTLEHWENVLSGEQKNIDPYRDSAHLKMDNTIDYEVCAWHELLHSHLESKNVQQYMSHPAIAKIFTALNHFVSVNPLLIPKNSLLREFIGKEQ